MALQRDHVVALLFGVVLGWLGVHLLLPEAPSLQPKRIYPSRYEIGAGSSFAPPIPREASFEDGSNASLFAECVERVESASTTVDDIVLAVLTTAKRHELIETLREHWLRDAKALLLTDAPGHSTDAHRASWTEVFKQGTQAGGCAVRLKNIPILQLSQMVFRSLLLPELKVNQRNGYKKTGASWKTRYWTRKYC